MFSGRSSVPSLISILILFLACILGCKATAPAPSWTKTKLLALNEDHPSKIIADGSFIYFVTGAGTVAAKNEGTNNIKRISLKDGTVSVLVKGGEHFPSDALAVDEKFLYWSDGGTILRVPKTGGESEAVVSDAPGSPAEMVVDSENIYWLIWSGGEKAHPVPVMFAPKKGGAAKQLAPPQIGANGICLDRDSVYWTTPGGIKKAPKIGGDATFVFENPAQWPTTGLISDAENFYYAQMNDKGHSALMKLSKKSGAPKQIAPAINHTFEFVADDASIYYFDDEPGGGIIGTVALRKAPKSDGDPRMAGHGRPGRGEQIHAGKNKRHFHDPSPR